MPFRARLATPSTVLRRAKSVAYANPLKGLGSGVVETKADHDGNALRAVYTVRFARAVYVLHVSRKKSNTGVATPSYHIDLVKRRLKAAVAHYRTYYGEGMGHG